jgi:hypothetical protein
VARVAAAQNALVHRSQLLDAELRREAIRHELEREPLAVLARIAQALGAAAAQLS